jgi:hypothetical protein
MSLVVALACVAAITLGASLAQGRTRHCGNAFKGASQPGTDVRASGLSCRSARRAVRRYYRKGVNCQAGKSCRFGKYRCRLRSKQDALYRVRCRRHRKVFSWAGGD